MDKNANGRGLYIPDVDEKEDKSGVSLLNITKMETQDKPMGLLHLGTVVKTSFGLLDNEGNVIPLNPIEISLIKCDLTAFQEALDVINKQKTEIEQKIAEQKAKLGV